MEPVVAEGKTSEVKCARIRVRGLCLGNVDCPGEVGTPTRITCRKSAKNITSNDMIAVSNIRGILMSNSF